ncbi:MAG: flagellar hook-basal body complex protein FliE [Rhodocyclaceae bacterium]|nr:flagellar hook-basal body complex protein FliE [Rhodocyclaceae bacterium]
MPVDTRAINDMLNQLAALRQAAAGQTAGAPVASEGADFAQALKNAIEAVNATQQRAQQLSQDFVAGKENVELSTVMIELEKASLAFQQMVQVRNKLVQAYQDVMNMPV